MRSAVWKWGHERPKTSCTFGEAQCGGLRSPCASRMEVKPDEVGERRECAHPWNGRTLDRAMADRGQRMESGRRRVRGWCPRSRVSRCGGLPPPRQPNGPKPEEVGGGASKAWPVPWTGHGRVDSGIKTVNGQGDQSEPAGGHLQHFRGSEVGHATIGGKCLWPWGVRP